jgi:AI-2 transport protein TqsA
MLPTDPDQSQRQVQTVCLLLLTGIALGAALYLLQTVLVPFLLALLLCYCLDPVIDAQVRHLRLPRGLAVVAAGGLGLVLLLGFGFLAAASVAKITQNLEPYQDRFHELTEQLIRSVPLERLGLRRDAETGRFFTVPETANRQLLNLVLVGVKDLISNGALVVIFMLFILVGHHAGERRGVSPPVRPPGLLTEIAVRVRRYTLQVVLFSAVTGLLVGLVLAGLGVEFAFVFGFLAFLLNFIPTIGSIIATLLPLPVILLSPDLSVIAKVLALALPAALQFVIGNVIQPRVMGGALELHPVAVLMALIFFGMIWGLAGAFLAMPLTAVIRIILERIPTTRPVAALMAGNLEMFSGPPDKAPPLADSSVTAPGRPPTGRC